MVVKDMNRLNVAWQNHLEKYKLLVLFLEESIFINESSIADILMNCKITYIKFIEDKSFGINRYKILGNFQDKEICIYTYVTVIKRELQWRVEVSKNEKLLSRIVYSTEDKGFQLFSSFPWEKYI
ncbi:hypothetical protein [Bacillus cereus group sp. TH152-1LC]|uniref:hypothetical protein n=1 Tax=Bacillus cereus group sp. TH152-1LC TaxID=3018060 RepID=UPI0022E3B1DD|nr:hypothetical protein [Bacillus cereus group sp. TH152-1LC]MDA1675452.1 hypothetical protein [Bacillus cereus group sp. TH152-1LC]